MSLIAATVFFRLASLSPCAGLPARQETLNIIPLRGTELSLAVAPYGRKGVDQYACSLRDERGEELWSCPTPVPVQVAAGNRGSLVVAGHDRSSVVIGRVGEDFEFRQLFELKAGPVCGPEGLGSLSVLDASGDSTGAQVLVRVKRWDGSMVEDWVLVTGDGVSRFAFTPPEGSGRRVDSEVELLDQGPLAVHLGRWEEKRVLSLVDMTGAVVWEKEFAAEIPDGFRELAWNHGVERIDLLSAPARDVGTFQLLRPECDERAVYQIEAVGTGYEARLTRIDGHVARGKGWIPMEWEGSWETSPLLPEEHVELLERARRSSAHFVKVGDWVSRSNAGAWSASKDGSAHRFDVRDRTIVRVPSPTSGKLESMAAGDAGAVALVTRSWSYPTQWSLSIHSADGIQVLTHRLPVFAYSRAISFDKRYFAATSWRNTIVLVDLDGVRSFLLEPPAMESPRERLLYLAPERGELLVFSPDGEDCVRLALPD